MKVQIGCELIDTRGWAERGGVSWGVPPQPASDLYTPVSDHGGAGQVPAVIESSNGITCDTMYSDVLSDKSTKGHLQNCPNHLSNIWHI